MLDSSKAWRFVQRRFRLVLGRAVTIAPTAVSRSPESRAHGGLKEGLGVGLIEAAAGGLINGPQRNEGVGEHVRIEIQPEAPVNCGNEIRNVRRALTPFCRVGYKNKSRRLFDRLS